MLLGLSEALNAGFLTLALGDETPFRDDDSGILRRRGIDASSMALGGHVFKTSWPAMLVHLQVIPKLHVYDQQTMRP